MGERERAKRAEPLGPVDWGDGFARAAAIARAFVREPDDIDDVVTEGILRLYEGSATYDPAVDGVLAMRVVEVGKSALRTASQRLLRRVSDDQGLAGADPREGKAELDPLERSAMRDVAKRIAALDEPGLARELAASGRTLDEERAKGRALVEMLRSRETTAVDDAGPPRNETRTRSGFRPLLRAGSPGWASTHGRSWRPTLPWLLASAFAMVGAVAFVERRAIVGRFEPPPAPAAPAPSAATTAPTPEEAALDVRHEAWLACREMNIDLCERKLDEAKKLDPGGESTGAVEAMRQFIDVKRLPPPPKDEPSGKGVAPKAPKAQ